MTASIERAVPSAVVEPLSRTPRYGTYRGALADFDLSALHPSRFSRITHEKRWVYVMLVRPPWTIALAIVDLGYAQSAFCFACHETRGLVVDVPSTPGLPGVSRVRQDAVHRIDARLVGPLARASIRERRGERVLEVRVSARSLELRASLALEGAAPALTAIAPLRGGVVNATEKQALAPVRGAALVAGERVSLDGALGGFDVTTGLPARETRWNWAFLMGTTDAGEPIALNLVQGFVGEPECALFGAHSLHALGEGRFELPAAASHVGRTERARSLAPWHVRTSDGACDLVFTPHALHDEALDLGLVRSRFVQPIGTFSGTVQRGEDTLRLTRVPGVVEEQDMLW